MASRTSEGVLYTRTAEDCKQIKLSFLRKLNHDLRDLYEKELDEFVPENLRDVIEAEIDSLRCPWLQFDVTIKRTDTTPAWY